jgi:ABC-type nitrate/sulfonate/bicarbonate transport system permease component
LLVLPTIQALRAVPAVAMVPFFLLWFGFSETGRMIMLCLGTTLNIAIATIEVVADVPARYSDLFRSLGRTSSDYVAAYLIPMSIQGLLPTLRVTLATCFGLEIVSELLGSQIGLGYLLQTARTTLAMHVIFLVAAILGVVNTVLDAVLCRCWSRLVFWR